MDSLFNDEIWCQWIYCTCLKQRISKFPLLRLKSVHYITELCYILKNVTRLAQ